MDSGEEGQLGRAGRAAARLSTLGYTNVAVVKNGLKAWRDAGYEAVSYTHLTLPTIYSV